MQSNSVPVVAAEDGLLANARAIALRWGLPFRLDMAGPVALFVTPDRLELRFCGPGAPGPVFVDFVGGPVGHRRRFGGGRGQPLARAVGLRHGRSPTLVDATAGLGRDGFVCACLGSQVTLVERSPVVAALLEDGLRRASQDPEIGAMVDERLRLVHADAALWLGALAAGDIPEVIYLDPMFPKRGKAAQVKKEMWSFQQFIGDDADAVDALAVARAVAAQRVVVKRPKGAPCLGGAVPSMQVAGKRHRYDVYLRQRAHDQN